jgi:hypothetical protein
MRGVMSAAIGIVFAGTLLPLAPVAAENFDHSFLAYAGVLGRFVDATRVDYAALKDDRGQLDDVIASLDSPSAGGEPGWSRQQRMAFWINAYNALTLQVIVDHYPIQSGWITLQPRNSIRQIDGVWTDLRWRAAGRALTLDDIEHGILRPEFHDPRIHFAINCASISCPPLANQPYRADTLDAQLGEAARRFLASPEGLRSDGDDFLVSSLLNWYGDDFVARFASAIPRDRHSRERAILGVIAAYGPAALSARARTGRPGIRFLDYNWSLNDIPR